MKTRLAGMMLAAALAGLTGCGAPPTDKKIALQIEPQPPLPKVESAPAKVESGQASSTPQPTSAELLARKTANYAKSVQSAMSRRTVANVPTQSQDSLVQWLDPSAFKIGEVDDGSKDTPIAEKTAPPSVSPAPGQQPDVKPVIQTSTVQANAGAAVAPQKDASNAPAVIPTENVADKASAVLPGAIDPLETRIAKRFKDYPRDLSANLDYQMMLFLRDEPVPQLQSLTALPTEDRELISAVMDGVSNFRSTVRSDNNMLFSRKIRPLVDLADRLKQQAELSIPTLVLCTRVDGFGQYTPIDPPRFPAQKEAQAIVYCELENFSSRQNDTRQWQTDVTQEAILYTEDGMQVWADKTQTIQDISRHRRHDFFLRTLVKLPATLTVGRYMLKVSIVDRQANRVAEASLPIQIIAQ